MFTSKPAAISSRTAHQSDRQRLYANSTEQTVATTSHHPSPSHRIPTQGKKRPSMLGVHSQRDIAPTNPPVLSPHISPTCLTEKSFRRSSQEMSSTSGATQPRRERSESLTKSLISKGSRLLKRQNSKFSLTSMQSLEGSEEQDDRTLGNHLQELSGRTLSKQSTQSTGSDQSAQWNISEPYNFHHLTHTHAQQFREIGTSSDNEIVTEFSAIRASQAPRRELQGIKADNLHFNNFSSEALLPALSSPKSFGPITPPASSPVRPHGMRSNSGQSTSFGTSSIQYRRSLDNFSQPSPRSVKSPTSPLSPRSRGPSRATSSLLYNSFGRHDSPTAPSFESQITNDDLPNSDDFINPISPSRFAAIEDDRFDFSTVPHAVTTPDDIALTLKANSFSTIGSELADVPEEEESHFWKGTPMKHQRHSSANSTLRHVKSAPLVNSVCRESSNLDYRPNSNELGSSWIDDSCSTDPTLPLSGQADEDIPLRPRVSRRLSFGLKGIDRNWEDDIDYCYEHAAEADCEFDWDRLPQFGQGVSGSSKHSRQSFDHPMTTYEVPPEADISKEVTTDDLTHGHESFISSFLSSLSTPDLEPSPVKSVESSTGSIAEAVTPCQPLQSPLPIQSLTGGSKNFRLGSLPIPFDYDPPMIHEEEYQGVLGEGYSPDHDYAFHNNPIDFLADRDDSPRSSRSPLSTCNSQESMLLSRKASQVRRHRSNSSASSLPELVHSKSIRGRSDSMAELAAEQATSLNTAEALSEGQRSKSVKHRRSQSLAKEIAHQSMLQKVTNYSNSVEAPELAAPVTPPSSHDRDRTRSDAATFIVGMPPALYGSTIARRVRSSSTATSPPSQRNSKTSYSLFPSPSPRSPS